MSAELKTFKSLSCQLCNSPFGKTAGDPKCAQQLNCGKSVCNECWTKDIEKRKDQRSHQCNYTGQCYEQAHYPSRFLLDILNNPSVIKSPRGDGYVLKEVFPIPECIACLEEFSLSCEQRKPYILDCGHSICNWCFERVQTDTGSPSFPYCVTCPLCRSVRIYKQLISRDNGFQEFLRELPEMTEQIGAVTAETKRTCAECTREKTLSKLFYCIECRKGICARCVILLHRSHKMEDFLNEETRKADKEIEDLFLTNAGCFKERTENVPLFLLSVDAMRDKVLTSINNKINIKILCITNLDKMKGKTLAEALAKKQKITEIFKKSKEIMKELNDSSLKAQKGIEGLTKELMKLKSEGIE